MSRATRDAAAAAEICFVRNTYATRISSHAFAQRNADRVTSLGYYFALNFASIRIYSQLRDLELELDPKRENVALLPRSLTKLVVILCSWSIDWENVRPLRYLQWLQVHNRGDKPGSGVQLDDSFAIALPLLRVFHMSPGIRTEALATTARVVMPHLVVLTLDQVNTLPP